MMSNMLKEKDAAVTLYMDKYNEQRTIADAATLSVIENSMKKAIADYNQQVCWELYDRCMKAENPMIEVIKERTYDGIYAKRYMVQGTFQGYVRGVRAMKIDLLDFCQYAKKPTLWAYKVERMGMLLTKRNADGIGKSAADVSRIDKSFYMAEGCESVTLKSETPVTTTQMVKLLQEVIDSILFVPGDKPEKNKYRVNNRDVFFFDHLYSTKNRDDALKVKSPKVLRELVTVVLYRLVTDGMYDVDYRVVENTRPTAKAAKAPDEKKPDDAKKPDTAKKDDSKKPDEPKPDEGKTDEGKTETKKDETQAA